MHSRVDIKKLLDDEKCKKILLTILCRHLSWASLCTLWSNITCAPRWQWGRSPRDHDWRIFTTNWLQRVVLSVGHEGVPQTNSPTVAWQVKFHLQTLACYDYEHSMGLQIHCPHGRCGHLCCECGAMCGVAKTCIQHFRYEYMNMEGHSGIVGLLHVIPNLVDVLLQEEL